MTTAAGRLIVLEGADGAGKSTLAACLVEQLRRCAIAAEGHSFPGRQDGTLGSHIYALHHQPSRFGVHHLSPAALQLLHVVAHVEAINTVIRPALDRGTWVVLDRFWWSTWVYGSLAGLDASALHAILTPEWHAWSDVVPYRTFLVERRRQQTESGGSDPSLLDAYRRFVETPQPGSVPLGTVTRIANYGTLADAMRRIVAAL